MSKLQDPTITGGTLTTDTCGNAVLDTGFNNRVDAMSFSFNETPANASTEAKVFWQTINRGKVQINVTTSANGILSQAVTLSWVATGF